MFETLIRTSEVRPAWKSTVVISLLAHAAAGTLLILLPLVYFQVVDTRFLTDVVFAEPAVPIPPSPPPTRPTPRAAAEPRTGPRIVQLPPMTIPPDMPTTLPPPDIANLPYPGDVHYKPGTGTGIGPVGVYDVAVLNPSPIPTTGPPPPPPPKPRSHKPVLVSTISPGGLIHRVEPVYPPLALASRVQGPVKLELLINEEGVVQEVKFISGHVLFKEAATAAVRQWRYRPTILNGEPVPIQGIVIVTFFLNR